MNAHISQFPIGTYKKGYRHGPGAHVIILSGEGYSLMWPDGEEPNYYPWEVGTMIVLLNMWCTSISILVPRRPAISPSATKRSSSKRAGRAQGLDLGTDRRRSDRLCRRERWRARAFQDALAEMTWRPTWTSSMRRKSPTCPKPAQEPSRVADRPFSAIAAQTYGRCNYCPPQNSAVILVPNGYGQILHFSVFDSRSVIRLYVEEEIRFLLWTKLYY